MCLAAACAGLSSCTTTYDAYGRPVQSVDPGTAAAGAVAAGVLGYAIADSHDHHYYGGPYYYGRPGYYGRPYYRNVYYRGDGRYGYYRSGYARQKPPGGYVRDSHPAPKHGGGGHSQGSRPSKKR